MKKMTIKKRQRLEQGLLSQSDLVAHLGIGINKLRYRLLQGYIPGPTELIGAKLYFTPETVKLIEEHFAQEAGESEI
jgi:hypothetical protein